ncbi:MAG: hypothetical protein E7202_00505 [Selenomonas ruminantium]|jgi:hypothetical protein|nr:hypothetical protein [Selenomonas ruminantium]
MYKIVIVVPVYQETLKPSERASLNQVKKVLNNYDLVFVAPIKMKYFFQVKNYQVEFWPNECFENVVSYSKLLLTKEFYERFRHYDYMLVYQLDAFVFEDKLEHFCSLGYDYIGAPIPFWGKWRGLKTRVGNGGLSLRKISSCIRITAQKEEIYMRTGMKNRFEEGEDQFFAYCGYDEEISFLVSDKVTALLFCIEGEVMKCYRKLSENTLPFGCHGWSKYAFWKIWKPYIGKYISNMDEITKEIEGVKGFSYEDEHHISLGQYLIERLQRSGQIKSYSAYFDKLLPIKGRYVLWGAGKIGGDALRLFNMLNRKVDCFFSRDYNVKEIGNIEVVFPNIEIITRGKYIYIVTVTIKNYINEIESVLRRFGLRRGEDYLLFTDIIEALSMEYYRRSIVKWGR